MTDKLVRATQDWIQALGEPNVLVDDQIQKYRSNLIGTQRSVSVALTPQNCLQVQEVVRIASRHKIPLYPFSTGKNWGYGSSLPVMDDCVLVDLSGMNKILGCDEQLGLVTIEPGVSQGQLASYLHEQGLPFVTPVTGSSPHCSLLGNALERGFGINPNFDHAASLRDLEVVLPSGELYRSPLKGFSSDHLRGAYHYAVGPLVDALFSQSNFGIVTRATISLAPIPESITVFSATTRDRESFCRVFRQMSEAKRVLDANTLALKISNETYVESIKAGEERLSVGGPWKFWGALYGKRAVVKAKAREMKRMMAGVCREFTLISEEQSRCFGRASRYIPGFKRLKSVLDESQIVFDLMRGVPNENALTLAYFSVSSVPSRPRDPAKDGCGLIWYPAIVPLTAAHFLTFSDLAQTICDRHNIPCYLNSTAVSETAQIVIVALLHKDQDSQMRAKSCYRDLFHEAGSKGYVPYRLNIDGMNLLLTDENREYWRVVRQIKDALDPLNIIAPGRYSVEVS